MTVFNNIEAIILDKDGVFVDFYKLWLRIFAYRAQLIAENSTETWEHFNQVRTNCIRAMGVDEDDETIDPYGPTTMPIQNTILILTTALYLAKNEIDPNFSWKEAEEIVERSVNEAKDSLNVEEMIEEVPGALDKIKAIHEAGFKIGVFTSDSVENTDLTLDKFGITTLVQNVRCGEVKTSDCYQDICNQLHVKPQNTIFISDSAHDLKLGKEAGAHTIACLTGIIPANTPKESLEDIADDVVKTLAELDLASIQVKKKVA